MVNLKQRLIAWLKVTLEAKGLVAALCICAMGLAALPWAQGPMAMALGLLLLFLGYQITQLMVITINEKKEEKKDEQEERLILTILEKCSTAKEL